MPVAHTRKSTITVSMSGGLGNQMFQYAAARSLALKSGSELCLDLAFYDPRRHRSYELGVFPLAPHRLIAPPAGWFFARLRRAVSPALAQIHSNGTGHYREPHYHYDPAFESLKPPVHIRGYFQSPRYFADHAPNLRVELAPPEPWDQESREIARQMQGQEAAAVHIRRGDYVSNPKTNRQYFLCDSDYYTAAMAAVPADTCFFVFSDDIPWAKAHLPPSRRIVFVGGDHRRPALADLWLMARARHHIIANSTLSWWGAWLAGPGTGVTIAPARWFKKPGIVDRDLIPGEWRRL